ncbi:hypothetical protein JOB18_024270 [Solea senegalensis]|uniref:Uncharacterized protein n=1 Tax=Solea senegalensis TaxID=28829 RepID=A0AAV6S4C1_SOLSE|nr:hypothetical protein JOB18_024270 [Solea senegalensis]
MEKQKERNDGKWRGGKMIDSVGGRREMGGGGGKGCEAQQHKQRGRSMSERENQRPNKPTKCDRKLAFDEFQTSVDKPLTSLGTILIVRRGGEESEITYDNNQQSSEEKGSKLSGSCQKSGPWKVEVRSVKLKKASCHRAAAAALSQDGTMTKFLQQNVTVHWGRSDPLQALYRPRRRLAARHYITESYQSQRLAVMDTF